MKESKYHKEYREKSKLINQLVNTNFTNLVEQKNFNGEKRTFLIGDNTPLNSFSRWTTPLFKAKFELVPNFALDKAKEQGKRLMESLEHYAIFNSFNEFKFDNDNEKNLSEKVVRILLENNLEIFECEKYFVNVETKEHGFIDLICKNNLTKEYVLVEIKTRNSENIVVDNITRAQTFFYKMNMGKIKSYILVIDRKEPHTYILEKLNYHKGLEPFSIIQTYWNLAK